MYRPAVATLDLLFMVSTAHAQRKASGKPPAAVEGGVAVWFSPDTGPRTSQD